MNMIVETGFVFFTSDRRFGAAIPPRPAACHGQIAGGWPMILGKALRAGFLILLSIILAGCASSGRFMMSAPTLYTSGLAPAFIDLPPSLKSVDLDVLYVTDREPETDTEEVAYGIGRSSSVAFGSATVQVGPEATWGQLEAAALESDAAQALTLTLLSTRELGRAVPTPLPWTLVGGRPVIDPGALAANAAVSRVFCTEIERRLSQTPKKEILLFVHGVANTFEDSVYTVAELWHYLGREGVPMVFSWPAGHGGLLSGYAYDRESGEFAILHFKQMMSGLTACDAVERINIIAHSRGTDVTLTTLRELTIAERAAGRDPLQTLRIDDVVLAAPDLDLGIAMQRVAAEFVAASANRFTFYTSANDKALSISEFLFGGLARIGQRNILQYRDQNADKAAPSSATGNVTWVEYRGRFGGSYGHSYFRDSPAVVSDIILIVRDGREPGVENGRPLSLLRENFWAIDDSYLHGKQP